MSQSEANSLAGIELLGGLSSDERKELERSCRWRNYGANEQIIDRQSETRDVFFVIRGRVRVVNYSLSGREITLDDLVDGCHFGELAAVDGQPRSASVMALTESLLASLPPEAFLDVVRRHPEVALRMMKHLASIVRTSTDRIMDLSTLGANNRVQAEILRMASTNMTGDNLAEIRPIPIHGDVASRVSTTRETVARVMNDLARQGILERGEKGLIIHDVRKLQGMVEEVRGE